MKSIKCRKNYRIPLSNDDCCASLAPYGLLNFIMTTLFLINFDCKAIFFSIFVQFPFSIRGRAAQRQSSGKQSNKLGPMNNHDNPYEYIISLHMATATLPIILTHK